MNCLQITEEEKNSDVQTTLCWVITQRVVEICGPGSVVGIATDFGMDGPGIESR